MIKREKSSTIRILRQVISLVCRAAGKHIFIEAALMLLYSGYGAFMVFCTTLLFDTIKQASRIDMAMIKVLALFAAVIISKEVMNALSDYNSKYICEICMTHFSGMLHEKAAHVEPLCYEDSKYLDSIAKAQEGVYSIPYFALNILGLFFYDIPYLIIMDVYLLKINPLLFAVPLCVFVPVVLSQILGTWQQMKYKNEKTPLERKKGSYKSYIIDMAFFKETRHLGCFKYFFSLYVYVNELFLKKKKSNDDKILWMKAINSFLALGGFLAAVICLYHLIVNGAISLSVFASVFYALNSLRSNMERIISERLAPIIVNDYSSIVGFINYMNLPDRKYGDSIIDNIEGITLKNVCFSYPGSKTCAVRNVSLNMKRNQRAAIVGLNGSGKSTLAKLLLGIYQPISGEVCINGMNSAELAGDVLYKRKTAVFQDFYKYLFDLGENVAISQCGYVRDRDRILDSADKAGLEINHRVFPDGLDTVLSQRFGGVDLSGGEWQKVAIARGFYRTHDLIVLDEPTAMIDPLQEDIMYDRIMKNAENKILVVITHRMAVVKDVDLVIFMQAGEILQCGTHDELMNTNPLYKEFFTSQSKWYC